MKKYQMFFYEYSTVNNYISGFRCYIGKSHASFLSEDRQKSLRGRVE